MSGVTVRQRRVLELHPRLKDISPRNLAWAKDRLFDKHIYACNGRMWCTECGGIWAGEPHVSDVKYVCPKCGIHGHLKKSRKTKCSGERYYFTVLDTCREWQVVRHYVIDRCYRIGHSASYEWYEAVQVWIDQQGREVIMARPRRGLTGYYDAWIPSAPMGIRYRYSGYRAYYINAPVAIGVKLLPIVKRNGYTRRCSELSADAQIKAVLSTPRLETLAKSGQFALFGHFWDKCEATLDRYWPSIRIAIRNGYKVKDATLWRDTIDNLIKLGKDIRNVENVCPPNLELLHDKLEDIIDRKRAKEDEKRRAQEARAASEEYRARMGDILALDLRLGNISARPLQTVMEFYEEGEAMSHCVYRNAYYNEKDSIIFTVRDDDGHRLATVEYSISRGEVLQCRGRHNSKPQRYKDIIRMFDTCRLNIERFTNRP